MPPGLEILQVSVETELDPLFGDMVRLEDRSRLLSVPPFARRQVRSRQGCDEYEKACRSARDGVHRIRKIRADLKNLDTPEQWSPQKKSFYCALGVIT
jgi:hypothetical protein